MGRHDDFFQVEENTTILEMVMSTKIFTDDHYNRLCALMASKGVISEDKFTAIAYYIKCLSTTHDKVINELLPRLLAILEKEDVFLDDLDDLLFDLKLEADELVKLTKDSGLLDLDM